MNPGEPIVVDDIGSLSNDVLTAADTVALAGDLARFLPKSAWQSERYGCFCCASSDEIRAAELHPWVTPRRSLSTEIDMGPIVYRDAPLKPDDGVEEPHHRWINYPVPEGWTDPVISLWQLTGEHFTDQHGHIEWNYILEGQLFLEVEGIKVELSKGDIFCIPAGKKAHYTAPNHVKMFAVYGANPKAIMPTEQFYRKLTDKI